MIKHVGNLFQAIPDSLDEEGFAPLVETDNMRIARIVSTGQATPPEEWYDQDDAEWVVVLRGSAGLRIEGEAEPRSLRPGDWVSIPAHVRHRVEWTDANEPTVWLAVHYSDPETATD